MPRLNPLPGVRKLATKNEEPRTGAKRLESLYAMADKWMKSDDPADYPAVARGALESAIAAVERSLRADGALHGDLPEGERAGWEWRALFRWAEENRFVFSAEITPARQGRARA